MRLLRHILSAVAFVCLTAASLQATVFTQAELAGDWTATWIGVGFTTFHVDVLGNVTGSMSGTPVTGFLQMQPSGTTVYSQLTVQGVLYQTSLFLGMSANIGNATHPFHLVGSFTEAVATIHTYPLFIADGGTSVGTITTFTQAEIAGTWNNVTWFLGGINPCTIDAAGNMTGTYTFDNSVVTGTFTLLADNIHVYVVLVNHGVTYTGTLVMSLTVARPEPFQLLGLIYPPAGAPSTFLGYGGTNIPFSGGGSGLPPFGTISSGSSGNAGGSNGGCGASSGIGGLMGLMLLIVPLRRKRSS